MKNHYQRVMVVLGKFDFFGKKFRKIPKKEASFWFHNYTLMIWIKSHTKCKLSSVTEIFMRILLGVLKWVINCLQSYVSKVIKINPTSNNDQTIEFCQNSLLQRDFFMSKSAWEYYQILYSIHIVYFLS